MLACILTSALQTWYMRLLPWHGFPPCSGLNRTNWIQAINMKSSFTSRLKFHEVSSLLRVVIICYWHSHIVCPWAMWKAQKCVMVGKVWLKAVSKLSLINLHWVIANTFTILDTAAASHWAPGVGWVKAPPAINWHCWWLCHWHRWLCCGTRKIRDGIPYHVTSWQRWWAVLAFYIHSLSWYALVSPTDLGNTSKTKQVDKSN